MSNINSTSFLLNLKDPNLDFSENIFETEIINGIETKIISATLRNKPDICPCCGHSNISIHGYKTSNIKIPPVSEFNAVLRLKKQRYKCKLCNKTFTAQTNIVKKNCFISNNTKNTIAPSAGKKISEKDIADRLNVGHNTVNRIINSFNKDYRVKHNYLPKVLCFDEFKSTKTADGAMSFIYVDALKHSIIDVVEDRRLNNLINYFNRFTKKARNSVKFIVMDMYKPYVSLVKKCFPKTKIIFDKFHIINSISRALNKTRIKIMNENKEVYNKFKKYYKLLLMDSSNLDRSNLYWSRCFRKQMTQADIVNFLINQDEILKNTYYLYQNLLSAIKNKDEKKLKLLINSDLNNVSEYMKTSIKTFKKSKKYIINAIKYDYTNGVIEGINNKIKAIKRIAFGYRSFYNFRNRILIMNHLICVNKAV